MTKYTFVIIFALFLAGCSTSSKSELSNTRIYDSNIYRYEAEEEDYDDGYEWAEYNDISDFEECQYEFGASDAEDGCNDYIKENYSGYKSFGAHDCTEDCSGHEAGYEWAANNDIYDVDDCAGYSNSFIEGCWQYVEDYY